MDKAWYIIFGAVTFMLIASFLGVVYDKSDWITLAIIIGFIITIMKLNIVIKLLEGKHPKKK